jgi:antirestriction protein ArdC
MYLEREKIAFHEELGDRAFYRPLADSITLPMRSQFKNAEEWYATLWHEMGHSTGHEKRLNRLCVDARFGDEKYAYEELTAEICSSCICNLMGIENGSTFKNTVAYIHSWIQALKNDKKLIVSASSKAEKAVQYIFDGKLAKEEG